MPLDHFFCKQTQRPSRATCRLVRTTGSDQVRFAFAVSHLRVRAFSLLFFKCNFYTVFDTLPLHVVDFPHAHWQNSRDLLLGKSVRLVRTVIAVEQVQSVKSLLTAITVFHDDLCKQRSFVNRKVDTVLDRWNGTPPVCKETIFHYYYDIVGVT